MHKSKKWATFTLWVYWIYASAAVAAYMKVSGNRNVVRCFKAFVIDPYFLTGKIQGPVKSKPICSVNLPKVSFGRGGKKVYSRKPLQKWRKDVCFVKQLYSMKMCVE